jgi:predicted ATPase
MQQIVAKTDGVPLFVEELTKTVVEAMRGQVTGDGLQGQGIVGAQHAAPVPLTIPATLQDSLMARLDRLGTAKEVAQMGATLGREFSYELLQAVSRLDEATLQHGLKQLVEAELVYQRGLVPQAHYLFKHALIQDTAYQSLLKSTRQQSHRQIAQVLAERFPETVETQPELVAHHYTEAGLKEQAIPHWQKAGQKAVERSANTEAIHHLTKGLDLLKTLPDPPDRAQQELTLQIALGGQLVATKGYAAPEVEDTYTRARDLCRQVGETPQLFPVLWGLAAFYSVRGKLRIAHELAEQILRLAQRVQAPASLLLAHRVQGVILFWLGELTAARAHLEQGVALYDRQQHHSLAFLYVTDLGVHCLSYEAATLWHLGYPDRALKKTHEALALAHELSHPTSLAYAQLWAVALHGLRREVQVAQEWAEALIALSSEQGLPFFLAQGVIMRGWALAEQGQGEESIAQIRQGLAAYQTTGAEMQRTYFLALLAEAYGKAGQVEEGLAQLAEALDFVDMSGERALEAELHRLKGELTLKQSSVQDLKSRSQHEAEKCFHKAINIARQQQAKSLGLRAVMSLSRLWQRQGKKDEARQMLAEIYGWFTEGFDTKDLQEAKALLDSLESSV